MRKTFFSGKDGNDTTKTATSSMISLSFALLLILLLATASSYYYSSSGINKPIPSAAFAQSMDDDNSADEVQSLAEETEKEEHIVHTPGMPSPRLFENNTGAANLRIETVFEGLEFPTAMAFLGEDDILVAEKDSGKILRIINGTLQDAPVLDVAVANNDERGLLGIAISHSLLDEDAEKLEDNFASPTNMTSHGDVTDVFVYFTESGGGEDGDDWREGIEPGGNRLYRYTLDEEGNKLMNGQLLLDLPATPGPRYNGGPVLVKADDNNRDVYVVIGDVDHHETQVQNYEDGPEADGTSGILRITQNGETVESGEDSNSNGSDNGGGILGNEDSLNKYYAFGMRQSFGMDFDPVTGYLWDTENGPSFGDEINLVLPGFNSGWKDVQGMIDDKENGDVDIKEDLVDFDGKGQYSDPEFVWQVPIGITAIKFFNSSKLGMEYQNDLFVGDYNNGFLYHFDLNGDRTGLAFGAGSPLSDKVVENNDDIEDLLFATGFEAISDIEVGLDGYLYVLAFHEDQGSIFRIIPEDQEDDSDGDNDG